MLGFSSHYVATKERPLTFNANLCAYIQNTSNFLSKCMCVYVCDYKCKHVCCIHTKKHTNTNTHNISTNIQFLDRIIGVHTLVHIHVNT
eukprot:c23604_g1_i1 orf=1109-1375(+)